MRRGGQGTKGGQAAHNSQNFWLGRPLQVRNLVRDGPKNGKLVGKLLVFISTKITGLF